MNAEELEWIEAYFDGSASPEILEKLDLALRKDENLRVWFLEEANMIADIPIILSGEERSNEAPISYSRSRGLSGHRRIAIAAAVVLGLGISIFVLNSILKKPNPAGFVLVEGWVQLDGRKVDKGERCDPPGLIVADPAVPAVLEYPDGSLLTLEGGSAIRFESDSGKKVFLEYGSLLADMKKQPVGREMVMETPNSTVTVLGTRYRLATTMVEDLLEVEHGKVRVLEKKTKKELVATKGNLKRVPGTAEQIFPKLLHDRPQPDTPEFPATRYKPSRSWFVEDFDRDWSRRFWELSTTEEPEYHLLEESRSMAYFENARNIKGIPGNALFLGRPDGEPPVRFRLIDRVGWDAYFLKFYFKPQGDAPFDWSPLCLDLPKETRIETVFEEKGEDPLELPEIWNRAVLEFIRFWDGEKWRVEVRRHVNYEHRSTVRLDMERTPNILLQVNSGGCLIDFISVGQLTPLLQGTPNPFDRWLCTEDFEPQYYGPLWDVSYVGDDLFFPISSQDKGAILQSATGTKGERTNVLELSNPSREGSPNRLRLRRRVRWDSFVLQYFCRQTGEGSFEVDPLCLQLPDGTPSEIVFESDSSGYYEDIEKWNKVRLEYRFLDNKGTRNLQVNRFVNDKHHFTRRVDIDHIPALMLEVKSGSGIFDWIDVRKLPETR